MTAWPTASPGATDLGIDWASDATCIGPVQTQKNTCFRSSAPDRYLPLVFDLYSGEAIRLEEQASFTKARDIACGYLLGTFVTPESGPMKNKDIWTSSIMIRALVVDHEGVIRFDLDSRN